VRQAPPVAPQLVFVPLIGFRPEGTLVLRKRTDTTANGTRLIVHAAAAAPDRTDVVVEWERTGDPATCPADSMLLTHTNSRPLEHGLSVELLIGASRVSATRMARRAFHASNPSIGAIDEVTFGPLPAGTAAAELRVAEGEREWLAQLAFMSRDANASAVTAEVTHDEVAVRATAVARDRDEVVVEMEVVAPNQIRTVGAPLTSPVRFASTSEEDQRTRKAEIRRVLGEHSRPITLEDDRGGRTEEGRRLFSQEPQQAMSGRLFVSRFVVAFEAPSAAAESATIVIPFIDLNDREPSAEADLRKVPVDVKLGEHRFRVISAEPIGMDQRQVVLKVTPSTSGPRFIQPVRMHGADDKNFAWNPYPAPGDTVSLTTTVGDPPIVTFTGAVLRVDGPLRLEIPLPKVDL
jgi:hypothetical protein